MQKIKQNAPLVGEYLDQSVSHRPNLNEKSGMAAFQVYSANMNDYLHFSTGFFLLVICENEGLNNEDFLCNLI